MVNLSHFQSGNGYISDLSMGHSLRRFQFREKTEMQPIHVKRTPKMWKKFFFDKDDSTQKRKKKQKQEKKTVSKHN